MKLISPVLALIWGASWALVLQYTRGGRFLAARRTWLTVVVGLGVDLVLLRPLLPLAGWLRVVMIVAASSVGIIARSLLNEMSDHQEIIANTRSDWRS